MRQTKQAGPTGAARRLAWALVAILLGGALVSVAGCSCAKKPAQSRVLNRVLVVGGFPVTFAKMEVDGDTAMLFWSAPSDLRRSLTKRRHFEFATGSDSSLVGLDGLRLPMRGASVIHYGATVTGQVPFDATGLNLKKLARVEINGARWVDDTPVHVLVRPGTRAVFLVGNASFQIEQAQVSGGTFTLRIRPTSGYENVTGTILHAFAKVPGKGNVQPSSTSSNADGQTFAFPVTGTGPIVLFIKTLRTETGGPFVLKVAGVKRTKAAKKKR